ncbi:amino acid adenylation domain-containing protein [Amycolatopsis sp. WQ 127309]|uniref:amino acid adenylation domain-containing protein n=1 Tax=Amycolatopsis sp. WQ 127309 TaxID=2932773 RepID=UPI001FF6BDEE|nr:amino acid adenylation domain-containing protein [Amycolatopsis sp. WQ 127309]UOZ02722.1 amino acid adenylation domain-containing protein [Amycolatopsis sp. WQ 127309]
MSSKASRSPRASCHALRVRLPHPPADAEPAFRAAATTWWPAHPPRLWLDPVPAPAGSPAADRRLHAELHRPIEPGGPVLRAVCLVYADGSADLVLVARRQALDLTSLRLIADVVTGTRAAAGISLSAPSVDTDWDDGETAWATSDPRAGDRSGQVDVTLGEEDSAAVPALVVAAGLVLSRYTGRTTQEILLCAPEPDRPTAALGAFDRFSVPSLDFSGESTLGELANPAARPAGQAVAILANGQIADGYVACQAPLCPLTLVPHTTAGQLTVTVHHRLADVDDASAERFATHLARVYAQVLASAPERDPRDLDLVDDVEAAALAALGRPSREPDWHPERIERVFARRVAERPAATAVSCEAESLTYEQLDDRSTRLAAGLVAHGVRPGDRVGVCLDRGLDLVATLLAVLKADAVYVPMDPAHPRDRLAYTVADADLRLVVAATAELPASDVEWVSPAALSLGTGELPAPARSADDAAYVIYTSGSTGRPKGVVVPHRNVPALLAATTGDFGLGPDDVWTLFHSSAFDFSVWEIWGALLTGGHLVVVPYWVSRSPAEFRALLVSRRVTVLSQTPSAFAQLMAADRAPLAPLPLRLVVFGGEALDPAPLRGWFDRYPENRCRLVNMFGITETTVHVTAQTITRREALSGSRSVGPALPGWHLYVLDERGRPLPIGVPGEIHVGGAGVAMGYLGRPALTAARFLPDPFTGGRMYRSGDRGRLLPDGRLEHLGRLDDQVKIRGFRIEPGEVRGVLRQCPGVHDAAVVVGGRDAGDTAALRLDAYVVTDGTTTTAIRRWAAKLLPEHMLPATITVLPQLPLTTNGKFDTAAVPAPEFAHNSTSDRPDNADDDVDPVMLKIWAEVLGKPVEPDDDFFSLGGNSLYAVRLDAAMQQQGLPALPLRELYLNPTIRKLTHALKPNGGH